MDSFAGTSWFLISVFGSYFIMNSLSITVLFQLVMELHATRDEIVSKDDKVRVVVDSIYLRHPETFIATSSPTLSNTAISQALPGYKALLAASLHDTIATQPYATAHSSKNKHRAFFGSFIPAMFLDLKLLNDFETSTQQRQPLTVGRGVTRMFSTVTGALTSVISVPVSYVRQCQPVCLPALKSQSSPIHARAKGFAFSLSHGYLANILPITLNNVHSITIKPSSSAPFVVSLTSRADASHEDSSYRCVHIVCTHTSPLTVHRTEGPLHTIVLPGQSDSSSSDQPVQVEIVSDYEQRRITFSRVGEEVTVCN